MVIVGALVRAGLRTPQVVEKGFVVFVGGGDSGAGDGGRSFESVAGVGCEEGCQRRWQCLDRTSYCRYRWSGCLALAESYPDIVVEPLKI